MTSPFGYLLPALKAAGVLDERDIPTGSTSDDMQRAFRSMELAREEEQAARYQVGDTEVVATKKPSEIQDRQDELKRQAAERKYVLEARNWADMISGEAYQPEEAAARNELDFKDLGKGLLTGNYPTPESLATGMVFEGLPVVGDILFGARDIGFGLYERNPFYTAMGAASVVPGIPSARGLMNRAKLMNVTPGMVPSMSVNTRALDRLMPTKIGTGPIPSIRALPYDDAVAAVRRGDHLVQGKGGVGIVGAPLHVNSTNINDMRTSLDFHMIRGTEGRDWYERARRGGAEVAGPSPQRRELLGGLEGVYSPQANPEENLRRALASRSGSAAEGVAPQVMTRAQQRAATRIEAGDPMAEVLGEKTAPFGGRITETGSGPSPASVNDIWHARAFGYKNSDGSEFSHGLKPSQHDFIDGETLLAAERANSMKLGGRVDWTPEEVQAAIWVSKKGESLAPAFTAKRLGIKQNQVRPDMVRPEDMDAAIAEASTEFSEHFPKNTAYTMTEAVPGGVTGHLPRLQRSGQYKFDVETHEGGVFSVSRQADGGDAIMSLKPQGDDFHVTWSNLPLEQQGKGMGSQMYLEAAREAERRGGKLWSDTKAVSPQATAVWERFVDAGIAKRSGDRWHMRPTSDWPDDQLLARQFSEDPLSSGMVGGRDALIEDVGLFQRPTLPAQGIWEEGGKTFLNPAEASRAMVGKTSVQMGQVMDDASLGVMDRAVAMRAYIDAQAAGAYHTLSPAKKTTKADAINAVRITGGNVGADPALAEKLRSVVSPYGFEPIHTGDGWSLLPIGENTFGAPLTGGGLKTALEETAVQGGLFGKHLGDEIRQVLGDVDLQRSVYDFEKSGNYIDFSSAWRGGEGSKQVTRQLLDILDAPGAPAATRALEEGEGVGILAGRRLDRDEVWGQRLGGTRKDVQEARRILRDRGIRGLREALEGGTVALPVLAGVVLGRRAIGGNDGG